MFTEEQKAALLAVGVLPEQIKAAAESRRRYTLRGMLELISHEAIVLEAYKDSENIWTWGIGVTNKSGHTVYPRYKDNPQSLRRVLEVFYWLVEHKYGPEVTRAFGGRVLNEAQFAAALSFHYNTGAINQAAWVKSWIGGYAERARNEFMNWRRPPAIIPRREKERDLFFDQRWSNDGKALVLPVRKPSYQPNFREGRRVDIQDELIDVMGLRA